MANTTKYMDRNGRVRISDLAKYLECSVPEAEATARRFGLIIQTKMGHKYVATPAYEAKHPLNGKS